MNVLILLLFVLLWGGFVLFLRVKKKRNAVYLFFFTLFFIYFSKVLDYTLIQFQSLLILKHFMPGLMLQGQTAGEVVNLYPLITLTSDDITTSLLNILLFIPFGFGLPFITDFRLKKVVLLGLLCSFLIETLQLITGLVSGISFRIADVNDLVFNTGGVLIGYLLFAAFIRLYQRIVKVRKVRNPILRYIAERPQAESFRKT